MQDDDWDEIWDLQYVGGMGSINDLREYDKKLIGKKKRYKRPIGFNTDIDKLELCDD